MRTRSANWRRARGLDAARASSRFDDQLLRHARELRDATAGDDDDVPARPVQASAHEPLTDLLNRLRRLQSK